MAEIFISYKSERRPAARHLKKVLDCYFQTEAGECVWYDYGLIPGDDFEPRIMAEIGKAKVVMVLWCDMAVKSAWVAREAREARRTSKFLPLRIETCALPEEFAGADTINLAAWDASPSNPVLHRLLEDIGRRIGREPVSRIARLRELEEDWRSYGAPSLAAFALGKSLHAAGAQVAPLVVPAKGQEILGGPPASVTENLRRHWENAQRGEPSAVVWVGDAFFFGEEGVAEDQREAARLYKVAADLGHARGQYSLAVCYAGGEGVAKDEREAVRLYKLAADQSDAHAQYYLGLMYENGRGIAKDEREAVRLYKLAADLGSAGAQFHLGSMYADGRGGVPKDEREAVRLYGLAVDQHYVAAQYNLGVMYEDGRGGLPKNEHMAGYLYKLAARQGNPDAQVALKRRNESW